MQISGPQLGSSEDAKQILDHLVRHNEKLFGSSGLKELTLTFKNESGELLAGLNGYTHWNWLYIKLLWTAESHRGRGLGRQLIAAAEAEARRRGASSAWIDTFSEQSCGFYQKLGYEIFGTLPDYPSGHARRFLFKARL